MGGGQPASSENWPGLQRDCRPSRIQSPWVTAMMTAGSSRVKTGEASLPPAPSSALLQGCTSVSERPLLLEDLLSCESGGLLSSLWKADSGFLAVKSVSGRNGLRCRCFHSHFDPLNNVNPFARGGGDTTDEDNYWPLILCFARPLADHTRLIPAFCAACGGFQMNLPRV